MAHKDKKEKKSKHKYSSHPQFWWESEEIHQWFKAEKKKLSAEAKRKFEKKYGKPKKGGSSSDS